MESHESKTSEGQQQVRESRSEVMTTQDSLNRWDEVSLNSIQGVCVDESVATSFRRIAEPALGHPPRNGSDRELCLQRENTTPKAAPKIGCSSQYTTSENLKNSSGSTQFFYSDDFFTN